MKNILVPVDFSELSNVAARYALGLAAQHQSKIHLLSVLDINSRSHALLNYHKLLDEMNKAAQDDGKRLLRELQSKAPSNIELSFSIKAGSPIHLVIEQYVDKHQIDLIVMGSQGATGLKKVFLGSNAAAVINYSAVPVIVVPGHAVYKGIKSMVYATDMVHLEKELDQLAVLTNDFNAQLHIIHVIPEGSTEETDPEILQSKLVETIPYSTYHFHIFKSTPIAETIDDFMQTHDADLLALFTHKLEFFEKVLDASVTRLLAFHNHVPILSFNKSNEIRRQSARQG